jgi:general secretion pathway protein G
MRQSGFTLLELLVVLAILGLLAAVVGPQVLRYLGSSKTQAAAVQSKNIVAALNLYKLDVGAYPGKEEGLQALMKSPASAPFWNGPYLPDPGALVDPWRNPYRIKVPGDHGDVDVFSMGSDNAPGGSGDAKDVGNW